MNISKYTLPVNFVKIHVVLTMQCQDSSDSAPCALLPGTLDGAVFRE